MKSKNTVFTCKFINRVLSGELMVHPLALTLAHDLTTGNSRLQEVDQGHSLFQCSASIGLAPSNGARVRLVRVTHRSSPLHPSDLRHSRALELGTLERLLEQTVKVAIAHASSLSEGTTLFSDKLIQALNMECETIR